MNTALTKQQNKIQQYAYISVAQFGFLLLYSPMTLFQLPKQYYRIEYWIILLTFITIPCLLSIYGIKKISSVDKSEKGGFSILFSMLYLSIFLSMLSAKICDTIMSEETLQLGLYKITAKSETFLFIMFWLWAISTVAHTITIIEEKSNEIYEQLHANTHSCIFNYVMLLLLLLLSFGTIQFAYKSWKINAFWKSFGICLDFYILHTVHNKTQLHLNQQIAPV